MVLINTFCGQNAVLVAVVVVVVVVVGFALFALVVLVLLRQVISCEGDTC
jgi:hypothetical protein